MPQSEPPQETRVATPLSRRRRLTARLRGEQDVDRLRAAGLDAAPDVSVADRTIIDPGFLWAVTIGDHTTISHDVRIIAHDAAGRHLVGYTEVRPVVIGSWCYIGAGVVILPGARIGDRAIVGAGAVVRGTVEAGTVVMGNPATSIGTVEDYTSRQRARIASHPRFEFPAGALTPARRAAARRALDASGRIYLR